MLHCASKKPMEKATALYCILQEGGLEAHTQISAGDKDLIPVFAKVCSLVTKDLFQFANAHGGASNIYDETECNNMIDKTMLEELREDEWLEEVYGAQSRLDNEVWLNKVADKKGKASWIFEPCKLRDKLMEKASVQKRH